MLLHYWQRPIIVVCLIFAAAWGFFWARGQVYENYDPVANVGLAKSLFDGEGYTFMGEPHTVYPPGIPVILALTAPYWMPDLSASQAVVSFFSVFSLAAVLIFWLAYCPLVLAIGAILITFSSVFFDLATINLRTELPYIFATAGALGLLELARHKRIPFVPAALAIPPLVVLAAASRTIGLALPLALLAALLHRRVFTRVKFDRFDLLLALNAAAGLAFCIGWLVWCSTHRSESYVDLLFLKNPHQPDIGLASPIDILGRIPLRLATEFTHYGEVLTNTVVWLKPLFFSPVVVLLAGLSAVGIYRQMNTPNPTVAWYTLGYLGILSIWPFNEGQRFIFPLVPMLLLLTYSGLSGVAARFSGTADGLRRAARLVVVASICFAGLTLVEIVLSGSASKQNWASCGAWLALAACGALVATKIRLNLEWIEQGARLALSAGLVLYLAVGIAQIYPNARTNLHERLTDSSSGIKVGLAWLSANARPNDVVTAEFAPAVFLYSGLVARDLPKTSDPKTLVDSLNRAGTDYLLILHPDEFPYYLPTETERVAIIQKEEPGRLELVYQFDDGEIYRVH